MTLYRMLDYLVPSFLRPELMQVSTFVRDQTGLYFHPSTWISVAALAVLYALLFVPRRSKKQTTWGDKLTS